MNALRIALLTLFVSPSTLLAAAPTTESTESYKSTTEQETVRFDNETFILAYRNEDSGKTIREFLPARQKLESWTKLAAIHEFLELNDVDEYALQLERTAKEQYPKSPTAVQKNEKTGQVLVDFVAWPEDFSFVEFNIFRIEKNPSGGIVAEQIAVRDYKDPQKFLQDLIPLRQRLLKLMAEKGLEKSPPQKTVAQK